MDLKGMEILREKEPITLHCIINKIEVLLFIFNIHWQRFLSENLGT